MPFFSLNPILLAENVETLSLFAYLKGCGRFKVYNSVDLGRTSVLFPESAQSVSMFKIGKIEKILKVGRIDRIRNTSNLIYDKKSLTWMCTLSFGEAWL